MLSLNFRWKKALISNNGEWIPPSSLCLISIKVAQDSYVRYQVIHCRCQTCPFKSTKGKFCLASLKTLNCKRPSVIIRLAAHLVILQRTPEMMNHVEVSDLREEASHSFSVVLAVSDGPGPAQKNNFSPDGGQDTQWALSGLTARTENIWPGLKDTNIINSNWQRSLTCSCDYTQWHQFPL